jgi:hypothetical protein
VATAISGVRTNATNAMTAATGEYGWRLSPRAWKYIAMDSPDAARKATTPTGRGPLGHREPALQHHERTRQEPCVSPESDAA